MDWVTIVTGLLAGIAACIPLAIKLIQVVKEMIYEKQWGELMKIVVDLMAVAEEKLTEGADKKAYVMALAKQAAIEADYPFNEKAISDLIDAICATAKIVNAPKSEEQETPPDSEGVA